MRRRPEHGEHYAEHYYREPDREEVVYEREFLVRRAFYREIRVRHRLDEHEQHAYHAAAAEHRPEHLGIETPERLVCEDYHEETEHITVTVVQPVRFLQTVPEQVDRRAGERQDHNGENYPAHYLLSAAHVLRYEIHRQEHKADHTAVDERQAAGSHRVVRVGQHLREDLYEIEFCLERVGRVLERVLAELQRIIRRQDYHGGDHRRDQRVYQPLVEREEEFFEILEGVFAQEIVEEIQGREYRRHPADIEVRDEAQRKRDAVQMRLAALDDALYAEAYQRQIYQRVDPHRVVRHNDRVTRQRVAGREYHDIERL